MLGTVPSCVYQKEQAAHVKSQSCELSFLVSPCLPHAGYIYIYVTHHHLQQVSGVSLCIKAARSNATAMHDIDSALGQRQMHL